MCHYDLWTSYIFHDKTAHGILQTSVVCIHVYFDIISSSKFWISNRCNYGCQGNKNQKIYLYTFIIFFLQNGVIFGPFCFLPFTIFSGFFVQLNDSHPYLRWIFHISYLKYGFEGLIISVLGYGREKLPCNADYCHYVYPDKFLLEKDMDQATYDSAVYFLIGIFFFARILAYFALKVQIIISRQKL